MKLFNIGINVVVAALLALFLTFAPPEVPLYFSRNWGENQVATKWDLLIIPLLINISIFASYWFSHRIFPDNALFGQIVRTVHIVSTIIFVCILIRTMLVVL